MKINGNNLRIRVSNIEILSQTEVQFNSTRSFLKATLGVSEGNTERIPDRLDGELSFNGFFEERASELEPGDIINFNFVGDVLLYTGMGVIGEYNVGGVSDGVIEISGTILTTGSITADTISLNQILCDRDITLCDSGTQLCTIF